MENFITDLLAISRSFANETKHRSQNVWRRQESLSTTCILRPVCSFILLAELICKLYLGILELLGPCVIVPLPGQLSAEAVPQPNVQICDMISIADVHVATTQQIFASMIPVH